MRDNITLKTWDVVGYSPEEPRLIFVTRKRIPLFKNNVFTITSSVAENHIT
jgi:hypothetical protein